MSKIISIGTAVPQYATKQPAILDFMHAAYQNETASRKLKVLFNYSGISTRYSAVPDFNLENKSHYLFNGNPIAPTVDDRLNIFKEEALKLALDSIQDALNKINTSIKVFEITHLITVTCTGLYAPGLDTEIIERLKLPEDIFHTSVNFMGCNAAFPALKIADMIAKTDKKAKILIVCVELCTLHFQPKNNHDNLLSNTIFGDGAAAVIVTPDSYASSSKEMGLSINGFYSVLLHHGKELMGWNITPNNFEMILDAQIPDFIGSEVNNIIINAGEKMNILPNNIDNWAIHPGGKKILDTIKKQLQLTDDDLKHSYKILDEYGNMSSPTILFVLNELFYGDHQPNETIFSIGFGPGLSIETALFTYVQ
jgi:predicted naringenin-chalcone synthase